VLISYVLRLIPGEAAEGRIVGEIESVSTGQADAVRDVAELVELIRADQHRLVPAPQSSEDPS
jgi:hypothetical protein